MEPRETDLKSIFCEAVEHPAGPDRLAYLERACGADPAFRAKVEELLAAHDGAGGFLGSSPGTVSSETHEDAIRVPRASATDGGATVDATDPPVDLPTSDAGPKAEGPGSRIGPYKLLQEIGQGGMGAVFMAVQDRPVRRRVALKVIKAGMDTAQVVARFEAERQALALMDHPNIARVFDGGTTDSGRPFFVMELVKGIPITQFCDEARLSPRERLELFIPVCQAIQHAHQKGIIHRDVKPTNVLVTLVDGKPVPKVIDFGVAKATAQRLTEKSLFTEFGAIVGTLEYMSPEQANLSALDVDTRSDVYALGVLLYELLTGSTPLERVRLRDAGYAEILRRIKEEEPPKPSTRLSGSGDRLASIAAVRGVDPGRLTRTVRGDLDWIVMKALEKSRSRRYESAGGFARDVQRYLEGDAVEACPPSSSYRLRKFVGKHRAGLATAAGFAALLIAGAVISLAMAVRVARERDRAVSAESEAKSEGEKSRRSAEESRAVLKFFQEQVLSAARPEGQEGGLGREVTIRQAVDAAEPRIGEAFQGQPTVEAGVRETLGMTYLYLGEWSMGIREHERAATLLEAKLGPDHPDTLKSRANLAFAYLAAGRTAEAIALHQATLMARETKLGPDHPDTLTSRTNLALAYKAAGRFTEAIALHQATLKANETKLGPDHPETFNSRNGLAVAFQGAGRLAEAIGLQEATLKASETKLGPDHPTTLASRNNLASAYRAAGRLAEAIALFQATLKASETKLGPDHPTTLSSRNGLALAFAGAGRLAEAIGLQEATLKASETKLGPDHPDTLSSRNNLAAAYLAAGRTAEAIALFQATLKACETKLGPDHPDTLTSSNNLALAYQAAGRTAEAIGLQEATLKASETKLGPDHHSTLASRHNLALAYQAAGRTAEAIGLQEATLRACETKLGPDHPDTLTSRNGLALAYQAAGRLTEAIAQHEVTLKALETKLGPDHPHTLISRNNLLSAYEAVGRTAEAEPLLREALERARKTFGPADPRTAAAMAQLGTNLLQQRRWANAEPVLRECLTIRAKVQPDDWSTFNTRSQLGGSLAGQKKYAEAEPLILAGNEGLKARQARIPPVGLTRLPEAADRVIELYESWGKAKEAARWRARLAPSLPAERLGFARMSYVKKRFSAAARLWAEALEADPKLGEDRRAGHRYNASCAAALAAAGKGVDEPPPDEAAKARLRGQALGWLQAELASWSSELETGPAQGRPAIAMTLDHWQYDPDLEGIREAQALAKLPEAERKQWQSLWARYASLLERARGKTP